MLFVCNWSFAGLGTLFDLGKGDHKVTYIYIFYKQQKEGKREIFANFRPRTHPCTGNQIGHDGRFFITSAWINSFMKNFKKRGSSHFAIGCVLSICTFFFKSDFYILALPLQFGSKTGSLRGQGEGKGEGSSVALASPIFMFPITFLPLRFFGRISLVHSFFLPFPFLHFVPFFAWLAFFFSCVQNSFPSRAFCCF